MAKLGTSGLDVFPLCLGGNVFGWTADEQESFAVLDAYVAGGGNFIDTADSYSAWLPGHSGGESETILGNWIKARGNRDDVVIATKVSSKPDRKGLAPANVTQAIDECLQRLQVDTIDLLYAHRPDDSVPIADTLGAFADAHAAGKIKAIGASNYDAQQLQAALDAGDFTYTVLQPEYNLLDRGAFEGELQQLCADRGIGVAPYYALAKGFLAGKHTATSVAQGSKRGSMAQGYFDDPRGPEMLSALKEIAGAHETTPAAVSLAWLAAQRSVVAPIASARTTEQLAELMPMAALELSGAELDRLTQIG